MEFVFANVHGLMQAKMKKEFRGSPFISFNSIPDLVRKLQEAQMDNDDDSAFANTFAWADKSSTIKSRPQSSDEDDMGFSGFS